MDGLWRRVGVHRCRYVCVSQGDSTRELRVSSSSYCQSFSVRGNVAQRWEAAYLIVPTRQKPGWAQNSDFPGDLGPRSV